MYIDGQMHRNCYVAIPTTLGDYNFRIGTATALQVILAGYIDEVAIFDYSFNNDDYN